MTPLEEDPQSGLIAQWVSKAGQDIAAADTLLSRDPPLLLPSCFHAQQAAEKYLKALLTFWNVEVPKTHDLGKLLQLVETRNADLAHSLIDAVVLNTYAVASRYPGEQPEPDTDETRMALDLSFQVKEAILPLLPPLPLQPPHA